MARIRSIHPGLWTDEAFVSVSPSARLLFLGILNESDDQGAFEWKPLQLKMRLAPADSVDVASLLEELSGVNLVAKYQVGGTSYGAVRNFRQWQRPKKPNHTHPMPDEWRTYSGPKRGNSPTASELDADDCGEGGEAVTHLFPTCGEKPQQMEDGGGREGGESKIPPKAPRAPKPPPDWHADEGYAAFYAAYPRKDAPADGWKAWKKAIAKAPQEAIMAGLKRYRFNPNPEFHPLPATWLNQERWLAEQTVALLAPVGPQPTRIDWGT